MGYLFFMNTRCERVGVLRMNDNSVSKDQVECVSWWVVRGLLV